MGREIFKRVVAPRLKLQDKGKVVAIDVQSETWAIDESALSAVNRLDCDRGEQVWIERVGSHAYHHLRGSRRRRISIRGR